MNLAAFDIETAYPTSPETIISISLAHSAGRNIKVMSWQGQEHNILNSFVLYLQSVDPHILFTWRGGGFDLPRVQDRLDYHKMDMSVGRGYSRVFSHNIKKRHPFDKFETLSYVPGRTHVDLSLWAEKTREVIDGLEDKTISLKNVARLYRLDPIEVDTSDMLVFSDKELREYNESDARVTLELGKIALKDW